MICSGTGRGLVAPCPFLIVPAQQVCWSLPSKQVNLLETHPCQRAPSFAEEVEPQEDFISRLLGVMEGKWAGQGRAGFTPPEQAIAVVVPAETSHSYVPFVRTPIVVSMKDSYLEFPTIPVRTPDPSVGRSTRITRGPSAAPWRLLMLQSNAHV
jgi:hypothetical protein